MQLRLDVLMHVDLEKSSKFDRQIEIRKKSKARQIKKQKRKKIAASNLHKSAITICGADAHMNEITYGALASLFTVSQGPRVFCPCA